MRKIKCKYCNNYILPNDLTQIIETTLAGKIKNINLHINCVEDYHELIEYKNSEIKWFNEIYQHIKGLLGYTLEQKLPQSLITRLKDIRNGTIYQKGIGRIVKSKEGYPYQIILDTFLSCGNSIRWCFENKVFETENQKINYMMAIIDSNINNIYLSHKSQLDINIIKQRDNIIEEEKVNQDNIQNNSIMQNLNISKSKKGISNFLEKDEL